MDTCQALASRLLTSIYVLCQTLEYPSVSRQAFDYVIQIRHVSAC